MSITLDYTTVEPVATAAFQQMEANASRLLRSHDWWAEPLIISHDMKSNRVQGSTRIFLGSYSTSNGGWVEVTQDEDYLLACIDARVIVKQLEVWSKEYAASWQVKVGGDNIGRIEKGAASKPVFDFVSGLCAASKLPASAVPQLLRKFENRKEPEPPPKAPQPGKKRAWWRIWERGEA